MTATHPDSSLSLPSRSSPSGFPPPRFFSSPAISLLPPRPLRSDRNFVNSASWLFPLRIEQSSRNSSRILERVDRRFERFQGRSGLTGEEACKRCRKAREKCEEEGIGVTTPTGRVHFPRRGGVDSLCVCLAGPGPRFLESRTWNS